MKWTYKRKWFVFYQIKMTVSKNNISEWFSACLKPIKFPCDRFPPAPVYLLYNFLCLHTHTKKKSIFHVNNTAVSYPLFIALIMQINQRKIRWTNWKESNVNAVYVQLARKTPVR